MDTIVYSRPKKKRLGLIITFAVVFALLIAACVYFYLSYNNFSEALAGLDIEKNEAAIEPSDVWENEIFPIGVSILELNDEKISEVYYTAPNGMTIYSHSDEWQSNSIVDMYEELIKNGHGDEMDYLKEIILQPGASTNGDFAGEYFEKSNPLEAAVVFNPLIDSTFINFAVEEFGYIHLYNMDDNTEVKQVANTFSHEYGHHYTFHYFFEDDSESRESTEYYELRDLDEHPEAIEYTSHEEYLKMHAWDISEIAAEDYVQLMGSPTGKDIGEYMDVKEALYTPNMEYVGETLTSHYNVFAQENPVIPLAEQVAGLEDYFYSFIDEDYVEQYTQYAPIVIEAKKKRSRGKTSYVLTWNELETTSEVIYTVVCYNENGSIYSAIKTVSEEEALSAVIGTPVRRKGSWVYWWSDGTLDEDRIVRVHAYIVDEGIMIGSEPYFFDF